MRITMASMTSTSVESRALLFTDVLRLINIGLRFHVHGAFSVLPARGDFNVKQAVQGLRLVVFQLQQADLFFINDAVRIGLVASFPSTRRLCPTSVKPRSTLPT